jgi:hypothetical protein
MIDPTSGAAEVRPDESLARYVLQSSHIRRSTSTVKPDAFIPHPYSELSVTRHLTASEAELWAIGEDIARTIEKTLYGRADISAAVCLAQELQIRADPTPANPNHANVCCWPVDKPAQKIIAQELAAAATFVARE